jgi:hypothetical protein
MRLPRAALLLSLAALGCGPIPGPDSPADPLSALGPARSEWLDLDRDARIAMDAGEWTEAASLLERKIALVPSPGRGGESWSRPLAARVRVDLFNLACARARSGRTETALDALEQSVGDGFGTIGWQHLAEDPDLDPVRGSPRWDALVRRLSWNEEVARITGLEAGPPAPTVVFLLADAGAAPPEAVPGATVLVPAPPYLVAPGVRAWTAGLDRGERAAEKVAFALGKARTPGGGRSVLAARGEEAVRLAWEVLLRRPGAFDRAVLDGPRPPMVDLLDRGAEEVRAEVLVAGPEGMPTRGFPARCRIAGSFDAALAEALR